MGTYGQTTFCLTKFEVKLETKNGAIFMFRANKILHYIMKNKKGNQYGMAFFPKNIFLLNDLRNLKG